MKKLLASFLMAVGLASAQPFNPLTTSGSSQVLTTAGAPTSVTIGSGQTLGVVGTLSASGAVYFTGLASLSSGLVPFISSTSGQIVGYGNGGGGGGGGSNGPWSLTASVSGILPLANGGTGTSSPGLVQGTNITITGAWPNQTINASGGGSSLTTVTSATGLTGSTNGITLTINSPITLAGAGTLTGTTGKNFTFANTLTLAGTDGSTLNIGTGGTLGGNAFTSTAFLPLAGGTVTGSLTFSGVTSGIAFTTLGMDNNGKVVWFTSPAYLPLTGGVLSGGLTGTTGTFATGITVGTLTATGASTLGAGLTVTGASTMQTVSAGAVTATGSVTMSGLVNGTPASSLALTATGQVVTVASPLALPYYSVTSYGGTGVGSITTVTASTGSATLTAASDSTAATFVVDTTGTLTTGTISSGSAALAVASTTSYVLGDGLFVQNAGTFTGLSAASLSAIIVGVGTNTLTLSDIATYTGSGVIVSHSNSTISVSSAAAFASSWFAVTLPGSGAAAATVNTYISQATTSSHTMVLGAALSTSVTGTLSRILPFLAVGNPVMVINGVANGTNLLTTVVSYSGSTVTLAAPVTTTVSGQILQHDDSAAINAAMAAAAQPGGGTVFFTKSNTADGSGYWRANGPFGFANSILAPPPSNTLNGIPPTLYLLGEVPGPLTNLFSAVGSGIVIDSQNHPTTGGVPGNPAVFACASTQGNGSFANYFMRFDNIGFVLAPNDNIGILQLSNTLNATLGDNVFLASLLVPGTSQNAQPTNPGNFGVWFPGLGNNVRQECGGITVIGFYNGIIAGEHLNFNRPDIAGCVNAVTIPNCAYTVTGVICAEVDNHFLTFTGTASVDLIMTNESTGSGWNQTPVGGGIYDPSNYGTGFVRYNYASGGSGIRLAMSITGGANLVVINTPATRGSLDPTPLAQWEMNGTLSDSSPYGFTLTNHGSVTFGTVTLANTISTGTTIFNGSNYLSAPAPTYASNVWPPNASYSGDENFTVCGWFNLTTTSSPQYLVSQNNDGPWAILWLPTGSSLVALGQTTSGSTPVVTYSNMTTSAWHFVAGEWNYTNHTIQMSVDGGAWLTTTFSGDLGRPSDPVFFGCNDYAYTPAYFLTGQEKQWRIYPRILSDSELYAIQQAQQVAQPVNVGGGTSYNGIKTFTASGSSGVITVTDSFITTACFPVGAGITGTTAGGVIGQPPVYVFHTGSFTATVTSTDTATYSLTIGK